TVAVEQEPTEDITTELVKLNPYRYAGYYWDRKTQYYYLQARYYDPRNGRFLSADTYRGEIQNPLSLHLYAYAFNNPVNYVDPTGHMSFKAWWYELAGESVGFSSEFVKQSIDSVKSVGALFKRETYEAIGRLITAIKNHEITLEDLKYLVPDEVRNAVIYQLNHEEEILYGDPSAEEAYQYGVQEGIVSGYVAALVVVPGALAKFIKQSSRIAKIMFDKSKGKIKEAYESAKATTEGTGKVVGSLDGLTSAEKTVINDLVSQGKTVEVIPKTTASKTPDFLVDGVKTELKTLENPNINTGITRIQKGFKQGAETVIIDGRSAGLSTEQAQQIINRAKGTYSDKTLPGKVEIWTNDGTITFP
ncbi:RHS repeat-associated core domain-containing protein, partial [Ferviditalea candida]|nr:RHS repeat-associated core domain-containing protein [Paenibacillaceae bacterium T2]